MTDVLCDNFPSNNNGSFRLVCAFRRRLLAGDLQGVFVSPVGSDFQQSSLLPQSEGRQQSEFKGSKNSPICHDRSQDLRPLLRGEGK